MRITKKREHALEIAISLDDVLYEKFRRLNTDLQQREQQFRARRAIAKVYQEKGGLHYALQITAVEDTGKGLVVICR